MQKRRGDFLIFEKMAEFEQCGCTGYALMPGVNSAKDAEGGDVVPSVLADFVGQTKPVGDEVHAQHARQSNRRAIATGFGIVRFDQLAALYPRHQCFHARQKCRMARCSAMHLESFPCRLRHVFHLSFGPDQSHLQCITDLMQGQWADSGICSVSP